MPIHRRSPKWGFTNPTQVTYVPVNVDALSKAFKAGEVVTPDALKTKGLIKRTTDRIKVLGRGKLAHALKISAHAFSASARKSIEAAQGTAEVIAKKTKKAAS